MPTTSAVTVRPVAASDEALWRELFRAYREFYELPASEDVVTRVWTWLMHSDHESNGLIAELDGTVVGIGHYRRFSRPSTGTTGLWLDDLFTSPSTRGRGVARAVISHLSELASKQGCSVVRWITAEDNNRARALYDQIATRTHWVTYDAPPARS